MPAPSAGFTLGLVLRIVYHDNLASLGSYIAMYMFVLLSVSQHPSSGCMACDTPRDAQPRARLAPAPRVRTVAVY